MGGGGIKYEKKLPQMSENLCRKEYVDGIYEKYVDENL